MAEWLSIYETIVLALIYAAILIYFLTAENNIERLHFILVVIGFFAILEFIDDFFVAQFFIAAWLVLMNMHLMIPRYLAIIFLIAGVLISAYSKTFIVISILFYIIILWGFLFNAGKKLTEALSH